MFPVLSTEVPVIILFWRFAWQTVWPIITHYLQYLSGKQTRQKKKGVYWSLSAVERSYLLMFIHVYFTLYLVNVKRCRLNWAATVIWHDTLKSNKTVFIVWISLKNDRIWKLRLCFIPKVTCSVLSVGTLCPLCSVVNHLLCEDMLCGVKATLFVGRSNSNKEGGS